MSDEGAPLYLPLSALRSLALRDDAANPCRTMGHIERLNLAIYQQDIALVEPVLDISLSNGGLSPCSRHHIAFATPSRVRIRPAGSLATDFQSHPIEQAVDRSTNFDGSRQRLRLNSIPAAAANRRMPIAIESLEGY